MLVRDVVDHTYQPENEAPFMRVSATLDVTSPSNVTFSEKAIDDFIKYILSLEMGSFTQFQYTIIGRYIADLRDTTLEPSIQHTLVTTAIVDIIVNFQIYFSDREGLLDLIVTLLTSDVFVNNTLIVDFITNVLKVKLGSVLRLFLENYNIPLFTFVLTKLRAFFSTWNQNEVEMFNLYFKPFTLNVLDIIFLDSERIEYKEVDSKEIQLILALIYFFLQKNKESIPFKIDFFNRATNLKETDINDILYKYAKVGGHWSIQIFNFLFNLFQTIASSFGFHVPPFFSSFGSKTFTTEFIACSSNEDNNGQHKSLSEEDKARISSLLKEFLLKCKPGKNSILHQAVEQGNQIARSFICASLQISVDPSAETTTSTPHLQTIETSLSSSIKGSNRRRKRTKSKIRKEKLKSRCRRTNVIGGSNESRISVVSTPIVDWKSELLKIQKTLNINIDISVFSRYIETVARRIKETGSQKGHVELTVTKSSEKQWSEYGSNLFKLKVAADSEKYITEVFVLRQDGTYKLFYKLLKTTSLQIVCFKYFYVSKKELKSSSSSITIKFSNNDNEKASDWQKPIPKGSISLV